MPLKLLPKITLSCPAHSETTQGDLLNTDTTYCAEWLISCILLPEVTVECDFIMSCKLCSSFSIGKFKRHNQHLNSELVVLWCSLHAAERGSGL